MEIKAHFQKIKDTFVSISEDDIKTDWLLENQEKRKLNLFLT